MEVTCLVSGGKDSVYALWCALHQFNVNSILTIRTNCPDSYLFHIPNCKYVKLIADMLELPNKSIWIESCDLNDEIIALKDAFIESNAEAVITGGILSEFQRFKFNRAAQIANMKCFNPLWRLSPRILMSELLKNNFKIIIVAVSAMGLGKELLGKEITNSILYRLEMSISGEKISLTGEGGEYETFVLDAPFFPKRIKIHDAKIYWDEFREEGSYEIIKAGLQLKK